MDAKSRLASFGIDKAYRYLEKDPEKNLPKLMEWVDRFAGDAFPTQRDAFRKVVNDPSSNWNRLLCSLWTDIDGQVLKTIFHNFILNVNFIGWEEQEKARKAYGCNIPWAILMDPTSACNLHCTGCWAAQYGNRLNMTLEELDSIIRQGKALGTYMYIYSGGEPLVRREDLIRLCQMHDDCVFLAFTNATLIDEAFCRELLRVRNFIPAISVEGFEAETDARRGKGTFSKVMEAMRLLRQYKLPFGVSCCYTSQNVETIGSQAYFDQMIEWGAKFAWFFTYMPVGVDAVPSLMATAAQREMMYRRIRAFRKEKPLFTLDFWNDGEYVKGCIAGGRNYLHINANGDIEPCAFIHYSDSNIREKTLLEAYRSKLFMAYHDNQPFNENHLRPCPVLDNPGRLTRMVEESGAHSTDLEHPESAKALSDKCVETAMKWAPVADALWRDAHACAGCKNCAQKRD